jgi:hypothetical protein
MGGSQKYAYLPASPMDATYIHACKVEIIEDEKNKKVGGI